MGFLGKIGDFFEDTFDDITGKTEKRAAKDASRAQVDASQRALQTATTLNRPFVDIGANAIPGLRQFVDDPTGASFLEGNPLFNAAVDVSTRNLTNRAASQGRAGSGGLVNELFTNYLALGDQFVNSGFRRAIEPVRLGQNAAAGLGSQSANLITGQGNAEAAGFVGAANADAAGTGNLLKLGGAALGAAGGFGGIGSSIGGFFGNAQPPPQIAPLPTSPGIAGMGSFF